MYVASGGLDCAIIIWSLDLPDKHCIMRNAHDQVGNKSTYTLQLCNRLSVLWYDKGLHIADLVVYGGTA